MSVPTNTCGSSAPALPGGRRLAPGPGPLTWRDHLRRARLQAYSWLLTGLYRADASHPAAWRWMVRTYRPAYGGVAAWHAGVASQFAAAGVPAYRAFLARSGATGARRLGEFPETFRTTPASTTT